RWPAGDVAPLVVLVGEPGRGLAEDGTYQLSDEQARAILDLRLQRLTGLEREKIADELRELVDEIAGHLDILRSRVRLIEVLRGELLKIREQFANPRRTAIEDVEFEADIEALIQREDMVVTVSHTGYIKRVPLSTVMPLPEDEDNWSELTVMFATANGYVRRNALSDFGDVRSNGKIAMKFEGEDADDRLIAVATCTDANDVLLATRNGKAIRF